MLAGEKRYQYVKYHNSFLILRFYFTFLTNSALFYYTWFHWWLRKVYLYDFHNLWFDHFIMYMLIRNCSSSCIVKKRPPQNLFTDGYLVYFILYQRIITFSELLSVHFHVDVGLLIFHIPPVVQRNAVSTNSCFHQVKRG